MQNNCFICGLDRKELDRSGVKHDFQEHIQKRHYIWNYLYYMAYLEDKTDTECTGIESYVKQCLKN